MRVLLTGSSGLIGNALRARLEQRGHDVVPLVRRAPRNGELRRDPLEGSIDRAGLEGAEAVVHLAGENVGDGRWTEAKQRRIRDNRTEGTACLSERLAFGRMADELLLASIRAEPRALEAAGFESPTPNSRTPCARCCGERPEEEPS